MSALQRSTQKDPEGIVACSPISGNLYLVYQWEKWDQDGEIVSKDKRLLKREDVGVLASVERVHEAARKAYENRGQA